MASAAALPMSHGDATPTPGGGGVYPEKALYLVRGAGGGFLSRRGLIAQGIVEYLARVRVRLRLRVRVRVRVRDRVQN